MALKRTRVPFYGKREAAFTRLATQAMRSGHHEDADRLHTAAAHHIEMKFNAHLARGRRKPIRTAGGQHGRSSRGY